MRYHRTSRNIKRWQSGEIGLRWTAAGIPEAERQFRRIIGYTYLATLAVAIERDLARTTVPGSPVSSTLAHHHTGTAVAGFRDAWAMLALG